MYKQILRPLLFKGDPERVHNTTLLIGRFIGASGLSQLLRKRFVFKDKRLENEVMGIKFENPVGLSAGFDKNAQLIEIIPDIGFGFMEVGSITAEPCLGNLKPRLHRLTKDKGIIVNYGLANNGSVKIYNELKNKKVRIPLAISIAKTNNPLIKGDLSVDDYFKTFELMKGIGNFIVINISCPNVGDGRSFEDPILLKKLLKKIDKIRKNEIILLKLSPDINNKNLDEIIKLAQTYKINGFIISNLTKKRENLSEDKNLRYSGGISGKPVKNKSDNLIKEIYKKTKGRFVIIGSGGIFSGKDAYEKIKNGASLVQLITGMIYEGPGIIKKINKELVELMKKDGYKNIKEVIGENARWQRKIMKITLWLL